MKPAREVPSEETAKAQAMAEARRPAIPPRPRPVERPIRSAEQESEGDDFPSDRHSLHSERLKPSWIFCSLRAFVLSVAEVEAAGGSVSENGSGARGGVSERLEPSSLSARCSSSGSKSLSFMNARSDTSYALCMYNT